jgi:hypothetical protein
VNWVSKQSAIALAFSDGWNLRPEAPWIIDISDPEIWGSGAHYLIFHSTSCPLFWQRHILTTIFIGNGCSSEVKVRSKCTIIYLYVLHCASDGDVEI